MSADVLFVAVLDDNGFGREELFRLTLEEVWDRGHGDAQPMHVGNAREAARRAVADNYDRQAEIESLEDGAFAMHLVAVASTTTPLPGLHPWLGADIRIFDVSVDVTVEPCPLADEDDEEIPVVEVDLKVVDVTEDWTRVHRRCGQVMPRCTCPTPAAMVEAFNERYTDGQPVRYRPVLGREETRPARVRGRAFLDAANQPAVRLLGVRGGVFHLDHIEPEVG